MVLYFIAFYTAPFFSKHFLLGLFVRSLSTQLFFIVVLLLLLLIMIAFSYVWFLSPFWVWLFHALYRSHLPPSSCLERLSSEQFSELGSGHLLLFHLGLVLWPSCLRVSVLSNFRVVLVYFFLWVCSYYFLFLVILLISAILRSYFSQGFFHESSTVLFFFLVLFILTGLHCLLRMHALNLFCKWHVTATLTGWFYP